MNIPQGGEAFCYTEKGLCVGELPISSIADNYGTPFAAQIKENIDKIRIALKRVNRKREGISIFYALKANRFRPIVDLIRAEQDIGIDVCSPAEVVYCKQCGFKAEEISYTGCFMSNKDLQILVKEGVHVNFDTMSAIRKYLFTLVPQKTAIGLRINSSYDMGFDKTLKYDDKFGFPLAQIPKIVEEIKQLGLIVDTIHCHAGWNFPETSTKIFEKTLAAVLSSCIIVGETIKVVDIGGGLGVIHNPSLPASMSVSSWADIIDRCLMSPLLEVNKNVRVVCEPGTGIVASAGVLVTEVNTVEPRGNVTWLGINAGSNINNYQAYYKLDLTLLSVKGTPEKNKDNNKTTEKIENDKEWPKYNVAGNINESNDVFALDVQLPPVTDGDYLALYPGGAYGSALLSNHCMRGMDLKEVLIENSDKQDFHFR